MQLLFFCSAPTLVLFTLRVLKCVISHKWPFTPLSIMYHYLILFFCAGTLLQKQPPCPALIMYFPVTFFSGTYHYLHYKTSVVECFTSASGLNECILHTCWGLFVLDQIAQDAFLLPSVNRFIVQIANALC